MTKRHQGFSAASIAGIEHATPENSAALRKLVLDARGRVSASLAAGKLSLDVDAWCDGDEREAARVIGLVRRFSRPAWCERQQTAVGAA